MSGYISQRIEEIPVPGKPLGRHIEHDPRSRLFEQPRSTAVLTSVRHKRRIPVLDQLALGSCTGNAAVGCIGTAPLYGRLPANHPVLNEAFAVKVYTAATKIDGVPGQMPEEDTGSTGLAVAKVLLSQGLIRGYNHTFSTDQALQALVKQAVIIGVNWYEGFDEPGAWGLVQPTGQVRGGHEFVVDEIDVENRLVWATNSWGPGWGVNGRFCFSWDTLDRLLAEQGDVVVPLRLYATTAAPSLLTRVRQWFTCNR